MIKIHTQTLAAAALTFVIAMSSGPASASVTVGGGGVPSVGDARMIEINPVDKSVWVTVQQSAEATRIDRFSRTGETYTSTPVRTHTFAGKYLRNIDFDASGRIYALTGLLANQVALAIGTPNYNVSAITATTTISLTNFDADFLEVDSAKRIYVGTLKGDVRIYTPTSSAATAYRLTNSFRVTECYGQWGCVMGMVIQPGTQKLWINSNALQKFVIYNTAAATISAPVAWMRPASSISTRTAPRRVVFCPNGNAVTQWDSVLSSATTTVMTTTPTQLSSVSRPVGFDSFSGAPSMSSPTGYNGEFLSSPMDAPYGFRIWKVIQP